MSDDMKNAYMRNMLHVDKDGNSEHIELREHEGSYQSLRSRIEMRVTAMNETKYGSKMGAFGAEQAQDPATAYPQEDEGERLCEMLSAMLESGTMNEEQCNEAYAVAARKGRCHNCGRMGHFAR